MEHKLNAGQTEAVIAMIRKREEIASAISEYVEMLGTKHEMDSPIIQQRPDGFWLMESPVEEGDAGPDTVPES